MMDPKVGRFISEDPIGLAGGDFNLFRLTGNDPINKTDPSGHGKRSVQIQGELADLKLIRNQIWEQWLDADDHEFRAWDEWKRWLFGETKK
jgi:uncharacterized protein RhaS with RHS repeats